MFQLFMLTCWMLLHQDVNTVDKNGWTALHFAAFHGRLGCIQLLLRWGGHADEVENCGCTAGQKIFQLLVTFKIALFIAIPIPDPFFTALHVMQTRYSEENSVCPSVRLSVCLSVRPSHA